MDRERRADRYVTPITSRWMVDTVAWVVSDVGRKRRGNGCGTWFAHARVRLSSEPILISLYEGVATPQASNVRAWTAHMFTRLVNG